MQNERKKKRTTQRPEPNYCFGAGFVRFGSRTIYIIRVQFGSSISETCTEPILRCFLLFSFEKVFEEQKSVRTFVVFLQKNRFLQKIDLQIFFLIMCAVNVQSIRSHRAGLDLAAHPKQRKSSRLDTTFERANSPARHNPTKRRKSVEIKPVFNLQQKDNGLNMSNNINHNIPVKCLLLQQVYCKQYNTHRRLGAFRWCWKPYDTILLVNIIIIIFALLFSNNYHLL